MSIRFPSVSPRPCILAASIVALLATPVSAATIVWDGGGADNNWTTAPNWVGDVAPAANDVISFDGSTRLAPANNYPAATSFGGINFGAGAGAFVVGGNQITLSGGIVSDSAAVQTINTPIDLPTTQTVNVIAGGTVTIGGAISGAGGLTKSGDGALNLTGVNNYTGDTILDGGTVTYGANSSVSNLILGPAATSPFSTITSSVDLSNANLTAASLNVQVNNPASNTITLGAGKILTVNGPVTIGPNALGAPGGVQTRLDVTGAGASFVVNTTGNFALGLPRTNTDVGGDPFSTVDLSGLSNFTFDAGASTGELRVGAGNARGVLVLANTSNTITAAGVQIGNSLILGNGGGNNNGGNSALTLGSGSNVINTNTFNIGAGKTKATVAFPDINGSLTLAGQAGGTSTVNITVGSASSGTGPGAGNPSEFFLAGHTANIQAGTLIIGRLSGATGGAGTGVVTFDTGTFNVVNVQLAVNSSGTGGSTTGSFTLGTDALSTGVLNVSNQFFLANKTSTNVATPAHGTFIINGGTANINADVINASTTGDALTHSGTLTLNGGTLNMMGHNIGDATNAVIFTTTGGTLMNVNAINGTGGVDMAGTETLILDGTNNYTGGTTISSGTLQVGRGGNAGTLGGGPVTNNALLVFNRTGALTVSNPITGSGALQQNGAGTITLGGPNTYAGTTEINAGTLAVTGSITSAINLKSGGALAGAGDGLNTGKVGNVTMAAGSSLRPGPTGAIGDAGTLTIAALTVNGGDFPIDLGPTSDLINVTGSAQFLGPSTLTPNPAAPAGTYTILTAGSLLLTVQPTVVSPTTTRKTFTPDFSTANTIKLTVGGNSKALSWTGENNGRWDIGTTGTVNWNDGVIAERFFNADSVRFGDGPTNRNVNIDSVTVLPGTVTVNNTSGNDYTIGGTGAMGGGASLTKSGTGALTLASANTYAGGTTLNAGTLNLNNATALGTGALIIAGGALDNTSGGPLTLTANNAQSWNADLVFIGTNNLNLGAGAVTLNANRTVTVSASNLTIDGAIEGSGGITKAGPGSLTLAGANTFGGGTTLNSGNLNLNHAAALGTGTFTIAGGTLDNTSGAHVTLAGNGQNWSGDFTFAGSNTLNLGTGSVTFGADRTVTITASNLTVGGVIDSAFSLIKTGAGTLTLAGANTYAGPTTINAGTVVVTNAAGGVSSLGSLGGGPVSISPGGALDLVGNTVANGLNFGGKQFNIAGAGVGGTGALTNSGSTTQLNAFQQVALTADATVGGTGRLDIRSVPTTALNATLDLATHTLTKVGANQFTLVGTNVSDGNIVVNQGVFAIETVSSVPDMGTGRTITYNAGTTAQFFNLSGPVTRPMVFNGGVTVGNASAQASTIGSNMTLNGDVTFTNLNGSTGALTLAGNLTETGGPRGITKTGPTTLVVAGTSTLSGPTTIEAGILSVTGSLAGSGIVNVNAGTLSIAGTLAATGALNVNAGGTALVVGTGTQVNAGIVSVKSGGTLAGSGTGGFGNVTMAVGANLRPGASAADGNIGTLNLNSLTVNGGDLRFNLIAPGSSDQVAVTNAVSFAAASTLTPTGGAPGTYIVLTAGSPIDYGAGGVNRPTLNVTVDPLARPTSYVLDTSTNTRQIALGITGGAKSITWTGVTDGAWNINDNTKNNWKDASNAQDVFFNNDSVAFGDGPINRTVVIPDTVAPGAIVVNNGAASDYTISGGVIGGGGSLTKSGTGALTLDAANTYSGGTTLNAGIININSATALGTGSLTINGGTIDNTSGAPNVMTANNPQNWNGNFTFLGSNNLSLGTGAVTLNVDPTITVSASNLTVGGIIGGAFGLTKAGPGTLTLAGASTYTGPTSIAAGTVVVASAAGGNSSLGSLAGGAVTVLSGATLDLSGNPTAQALNFGTKQFIIEGTGVDGNGVITNSGVSQFNTFQRVTLANNATIGGIQRYDIRGANSQLDLAGHTLTKIGSNQFSLVATNVSDGNIVVDSGTFSIETTTAIPDLGTGTKITFNAGTNAQFFSNTAAVSSVTRPMVFNGNGIQIGSASNGNNSIVGSPITLNGDVTVTNLNNTNNTSLLTLTGNISETGGARSITKNGPSTLVLSGTSSYTGATIVNDGMVVVDGSLNGTVDLNVNAGRLRLGAADRLADTATLSLTGGVFDSNGFNETLGAVTLTGAADLELGLGASILHFANSSAALWSGALSITSWSGSPNGGGTDQLFFGNSVAGLRPDQLAVISFLDPFGPGSGILPARILTSGEVVAIPEPGTFAMLIGALGLLAFRRQRATPTR